MTKLVIPGSDAGFFSVFRGTVGAFTACESVPDSAPFPFWTNTIYDDWSMHDQFGSNVWEWYFEVDFPSHGEKLINHPHIILPREYQTRVTMHEMIKKYVRPLPYILEDLADLIEAVGPNPLGLHIRRTDKNECTRFGEPETGKPVPLSKYIEHAEKYLENRPESRIFLSTDDYSVIECMQEHFPKRVSFQKDCIRSTGNISVHHGDKLNGYKKGKDVLIDCLMLSQCDHIIKGISNVALCAMFFNLDLTAENMNSIYNCDTREDFVNDLR